MPAPIPREPPVTSVRRPARGLLTTSSNCAVSITSLLWRSNDSVEGLGSCVPQDHRGPCAKTTPSLGFWCRTSRTRPGLAGGLQSVDRLELLIGSHTFWTVFSPQATGLHPAVGSVDCREVAVDPDSPRRNSSGDVYATLRVFCPDC